MPDGLTIEAWKALARKCLIEGNTFNEKVLGGVLFDIIEKSDDSQIGYVLDRWGGWLLEHQDGERVA